MRQLSVYTKQIALFHAAKIGGGYAAISLAYESYQSYAFELLANS